jgi:hypothetical protein
MPVKTTVRKLSLASNKILLDKHIIPGNVINLDGLDFRITYINYGKGRVSLELVLDQEVVS